MKIVLSESNHQYFLVDKKKIYKVCISLEEAKKELSKWKIS